MFTAVRYPPPQQPTLKTSAVKLPVFTHPLKRDAASSRAGLEKDRCLHTELRSMLYSSCFPLEDSSSALALLPSRGLELRTLAYYVTVSLRGCDVRSFCVSPDDVALLVIERRKKSL